MMRQEGVPKEIDYRKISDLRIAYRKVRSVLSKLYAFERFLRSSHVGMSSCIHVHVGSRRFYDQSSGEIGHSDHKASRSCILVVIRVSVRSIVLEGIYFRKKHVS